MHNVRASTLYTTWRLITLALSTSIILTVFSSCSRSTDSGGNNAETTPTPAASLTIQPHKGGPEVPFEFSASTVGLTQPLAYEWDYNGDGIGDSTSSAPQQTTTVSALGTYASRVTVTDANGKTATAYRHVEVIDDQDSEWGEFIRFTINGHDVFTSESGYRYFFDQNEPLSVSAFVRSSISIQNVDILASSQALDQSQFSPVFTLSHSSVKRIDFPPLLVAASSSGNYVIRFYMGGRNSTLIVGRINVHIGPPPSSPSQSPGIGITSIQVDDTPLPDNPFAMQIPPGSTIDISGQTSANTQITIYDWVAGITSVSTSTSSGHFTYTTAVPLSTERGMLIFKAAGQRADLNLNIANQPPAVLTDRVSILNDTGRTVRIQCEVMLEGTGGSVPVSAPTTHTIDTVLPPGQSIPLVAKEDPNEPIIGVSLATERCFGLSILKYCRSIDPSTGVTTSNVQVGLPKVFTPVAAFYWTDQQDIGFGIGWSASFYKLDAGAMLLAGTDGIGARLTAGARRRHLLVNVSLVEFQ